MASPLQAAKRSVDLQKGGGLGRSRIRRDPPPVVVVKEVSPEDRDERDRRMAVVGIVAYALALTIIIIGLSGVTGWSPAEHIVRL